MKKILLATAAPLLSLFIFILGSGLFTTLLTVRLHHDRASALFIGAVTGAYYAGLAVGSFKIERFILRVGHIRAFSAFAAFIAAVSLLQGLLISPWIWLLLRFSTGFATAGIFIVIESWLLSSCDIKIRGQILALYMISLYAGQALGQFMMNVSSTQTLTLFAITSILSSLAIIPLALTKISSPEITEPSTLNFKKLFKASGSGLTGSFCSGLVLGSIYGLFPLIIIQKTASNSAVSLFMALIIFGGMSLQFPVGRLSDYIERRLVLLGLALVTILVSFVMIYSFHFTLLAYLICFLLGGLTFTLYPVSISLTCDNLEQSDIVSGTQGVLLAYSIGATVGPFIAPLYIHFIGSNGLFIYIITVCVLLSIFLVWRKTNIESTPQDDPFVAMPLTTPVTAEFDPRANPDAGKL